MVFRLPSAACEVVTGHLENTRRIRKAQFGCHVSKNIHNHWFVLIGSFWIFPLWSTSQVLFPHFFLVLFCSSFFDCSSNFAYLGDVSVELDFADVAGFS